MASNAHNELLGFSGTSGAIENGSAVSGVTKRRFVETRNLDRMGLSRRPISRLPPISPRGVYALLRSSLATYRSQFIHRPARRNGQAQFMLLPLNDLQLTNGIAPHPTHRYSPAATPVRRPYFTRAGAGIDDRRAARGGPWLHVDSDSRGSSADAPHTTRTTPRRTGCPSTPQRQHFGMQP
jgi:hypothetical protein